MNANEVVALFFPSQLGRASYFIRGCVEANRCEVRFANLVPGHLLETDLGGLRPTVLIAKIAQPKAQTSAMY